jgi:tetratricopeptide (TPR) repeat protein
MLIVGLLCNDYEEEPHVRFLPDDLFGIEGAHRLGRVTTEAVFRASFERLESRLQSLLMAVSVFAKPFDLTMAATMIADEEVTDRDLLLLKKRGFVLAESGCYRFQPQIQELVQRQAADLLELHRRAINFYLTLCEAKPTLDPRYDTLEDADPYLQIFHHYCELGEYESAFYVLRNDLNKVDTFLSLHGYYERLVNLYSLLVKSWRLDQLQKLEYTDALINLGNAYRSSGQYQKAIFYHQQSLQISQSIGNKLNELGSLGNLGLTYYFLGQYQESLSFHQQALQISRIIFDKNGEAKSLGNLGSIYGCLEQYDKSIESHLSALAITREIDDRFWEAGILCNLGIAYYCLEQYQESLTFHQQSLEIKQEIGDKKGEANSLGSLGNVYCSLAQYKEAINFYQKSLKMLHMMDDKHSEATFLDNLGLAYYSLKQYREARSSHQQSLGLRQIIGDRLGEAASLGNIGNVNYCLGLYQEAINFYQQSLEIKRSISDRRGEVDSLINLAIAYIQVGKLKEGIDSGLRVIKISQELKLPLKAMPYPNWYKSIIRFAQRGKWQIAICFCIGLFAFPLFLAYLVALLLWRLIKEKGKR